MSRKISLQEAREWLALNSPSISIEDDSDWGGCSSARSWFTCICGKRWETTFTSVKMGTGCPLCNGGIRYDEPFVEKWLAENGVPIGIHEYRGNAHDPSSWWKCLACGILFHTRFTNIVCGSRCPKCAQIKQHEQQRETYAEARLFIDSNFPNLSLVLYGGSSSSKSWFYCSDCDAFVDTTISRLKKHVRLGARGNGCRFCRDIAHGKMCRMDEGVAKAICAEHGFVLLSYAGTCSARTSLIECGHGHTWPASINTIASGHGCPICADRGFKRFIVEGQFFDSSWEVIVFLYHKYVKGSDISRITCYDPRFAFPYDFQGGSHTWYPDFVINNVVYEVKPDNGGRYYNEILKTQAKKEANIKNGYGIVFIGDRECRQWKKQLDEIGMDYMQYEV